MRFIPGMKPIFVGWRGWAVCGRWEEAAAAWVSTLQGANFSQTMKWAWAKLIPNSRALLDSLVLIRLVSSSDPSFEGAFVQNLQLWRIPVICCYSFVDSRLQHFRNCFCRCWIILVMLSNKGKKPIKLEEDSPFKPPPRPNKTLKRQRDTFCVLSIIRN